MRMLIVDDDATSRRLLSGLMSDFAECETAEDGKSALETFRKGWEKCKPFDIITLDIKMPDIDGKEVLKAIRSLEEEKNIPKGKQAKILMATAVVDKDTILTCIQMGCDDYIAKPFDKNTILKKFKQLGFYFSDALETDTEIKTSYKNLSPESQTDHPSQTSQKNKKTLQEHIARIVQKFKADKIDLPVLPDVVAKIQSITNNSDATISDLAKAVEKDSVISLRLIAAANSPFYRGAEKISTVEKAIPRLGFIETASIINAIANKSIYSSPNKQFKLLMENLWMHSLASAYGASVISKKLALGHDEKYFFMGLIHDIGKVLLLKALGEVSLLELSISISDILTAIQNVHTNFGGAIIKRWGLSDDYGRVALYHENSKFDQNAEKDVLIVNLASNLAHSMGYTLLDNGSLPPESNAAALLGIEAPVIEEIRSEVRELVTGYCDVF